MGEFSLNSRSAFLRGLILHDERVNLSNLDPTLSAYTEAGEEPSQPTPDVKGYMELEATGTCPDGGYDIDIVAQKEGAPVGGDSGGRFRWKNSTDGVGDWRGCLAPNKITGFGWVRSGNDGTKPRAIRTPDHKVVCAYSMGTGDAVRCSVLDPETETWTESTVFAPSTGKHPALIRLPDNTANGGRLICFYTLSPLVASAVLTRWRLAFSYSDDDGATWTEGGYDLPGYDSANVPTDIQAVYSSGYVTLIVNETPNRLLHFVSSDLGASFTEVENIDWMSGTLYRVGRLAVDSGGSVVMLFLGATGTPAGSDIFWARKSTPYAKFSDDPTYGTQLSDELAYELDCCVDDAGFLLVIWRNGSPDDGIIGMGRFNVDTLEPAKDRWMSSGKPYTNKWPIYTGDSAEILTDFAICPYKAGMVMVSGWEVSAGGPPNNLMDIRLGGYSSVDWTGPTFGYQDGSPLTKDGVTWLPYQTPALVADWTSSGGAGTGSLTTDGFQITTSTNELSFSRSGSTDGNPVLVWARVRSTSGGSLGSEEIGFRATRADGAVQYRVSFRVNLTAGAQQLRLYDTEGAAQVGSDATGLTTGFLDVLVAMETSKVSAWYKPAASEVWTAWISGQTIVDGGAGLAANKIEWGNRASGTATSEWLMFNSSMDDEGSPLGLTSFSNPTDLQGRAFSSRELYLTGGTRLKATAGPAYQGDSWDAVNRAQYGIQHIHPEISPSPSVMWRQRGTTLAHLAWNLDAGMTTRLLSSSIGCALIRPNFREAFLEGYDGATWTTLLTFDGAETVGASLTYQITGNHLRAAAGSPAGARYLEGNELVGGYVELDYTGGGGGTVVASIEEHSEGVWRAPNAGRSAEFRVRSSSLGSINTPTNCRFIPPILVGVRHNATAHYQAYRIRIPSGQATKQGYYMLGGVVLGPLAVLGMQNSWGRAEAIEPNQEIVTTTSGARQVRKLGPARRRVELSWTDGWDTSELYGATPDPDYLVARTGAGFEGIGVRDDATLLRGVLRRQAGAVRPVVYLPKIDPSTPVNNVFQYSSPAKALYGRIVSPVSSTAILGNEAQDEVITIDAITIEEEV